VATISPARTPSIADLIPSIPVTSDFAGQAFGSQSFKCASRHVIVGAPDAIDLISETSDPGID
jgi:hypothetical protein